MLDRLQAAAVLRIVSCDAHYEAGVPAHNADGACLCRQYVGPLRNSLVCFKVGHLLLAMNQMQCQREKVSAMRLSPALSGGACNFEIPFYQNIL